jgi:hypothetical protein
MRSASTQVGEMIAAVFSMITMTCVDSKLATALRLDMAIHNSKPVSWPERLNFSVLREEFMSGMLVFFQEWNACYRVLRHRNFFSFVDSIRFGLWLAQG